MTDDFAVVDAGDAGRLISMMHATDAWPAVQAARAWVLGRAAPEPGAVVVDAGCGPGTFGGLAARGQVLAIDLDRSRAMLDAARHTHPTSRGVCGSIDRLPLRSGVAALTRAERVLQWSTDPRAALGELARVTAPGGVIAVTDTDWGSFRITGDRDLADGWSAAALGWVPHPHFAERLAHRLEVLGRPVERRHDVVVVTEWDPDDPDHADGPPGLPLRSIAAGAPAGDRTRLRDDIGRLAGAARRGRFRAELTLVTALVRRPPASGDADQKSVRYSSS